MKDAAMTFTQLFADSYKDYHRTIYLYIYYRVNNKEEAEDLSQDMFLRLMDYRQMLCSDTIKYFIFTVTRNLVIDYLRRCYKTREIASYIYDCASVSVDN